MNKEIKEIDLDDFDLSLSREINARITASIGSRKSETGGILPVL